MSAVDPALEKLAALLREQTEANDAYDAAEDAANKAIRRVNEADQAISDYLEEICALAKARGETA